MEAKGAWVESVGKIIRRKSSRTASISASHQLFATVPLGAEELAAAELNSLGASDVTVTRGGVSFIGTTDILYTALLQLRTVSRVLLKLVSFPASTPQELYDGVRTIKWQDMLTPSMTIAVDCTLRDSSITHSHFAALKTKDAIVDSVRDQAGSRPTVDTKSPDVRINLHLAKNQATISLDASGEPLDRRGWRLDRNAAPLRETLAAAIMMHTGWNGSVPLIDPMCGSGTMLLEGVSMALGLPTGSGRDFGVMRWRDFDRALWGRLTNEARLKSRDSLDSPVLGFDRDPKAVIACRENARRAALSYSVSFDRRSFEDTEPCGHEGVVVMNPPYGVRMGDRKELEQLYRKIGEVFKRRFAGWTAYLLAGDLELARLVGLKPSRRYVLFNGPLECRLLKYELY